MIERQRRRISQILIDGCLLSGDVPEADRHELSESYCLDFWEITLHKSNQHGHGPLALLATERCFARGMLIAYPDGRFVAVNGAFCEFLGYSEQELLKKDIASVIHPEDVALSMQKVRKALAERSGFQHFEKRYLRKDGEVRWAETTASLVRSAEGEPRYFVTQVVDISKRKRAEEALRESEEKFRLLLESTAEATPWGGGSAERDNSTRSSTQDHSMRNTL